MGRVVTAGTLLTRIRRAIDRPIDDGFITDAEIYNQIQQSYAFLWDKCARNGMPLQEAEDTIAGVTGTREYALNSDFLYVIDVSYAVDSYTRVSLTPLDPHERNNYTREPQSPSVAYSVYTDASSDEQLVLYPPPKTGDTYYVTYVPYTPTIDDSNDEIVGINGWEEWIVRDCAAVFAVKEHLDPSPHIALRDQHWTERLSGNSMRRQGPSRVTDTASRRPRDGGDWFPSTKTDPWYII